jgi:hypothetical protein
MTMMNLFFSENSMRRSIMASLSLSAVDGTCGLSPGEEAGRVALSPP